MSMKRAVSLFTGGAIGDTGFRAAGYSYTTMCEIDTDRAQLAKLNFPDTAVIARNIWECKSEFIEVTRKALGPSENPFLVVCTAPCQGMSKSGQGTLLRRIREGKRPKLDPRNRLILPALEIISALKPQFVVFENVCEMRNTVIEVENGEAGLILDVIRKALGRPYSGEAYDVEFADYGIPERRKRLITIYTRDENAAAAYEQGVSLLPAPTHSAKPKPGLGHWITAKDVLSQFPQLDARGEDTASDETIPFHRVAVMDPKKYNWIKYAPPGASAFDNQCINPSCMYQLNRAHGAERNHEGINQAKKDTPLYCEKCGSLLPRPYTVGVDGKKRIMSGYTSAYKRMEPDLPVPALTRNLFYVSSDNKVHPFQNRVLSLAEAFVIHTIADYHYSWGPFRSRQGRISDAAPDTLIADVIGESVPPRFFELLGRHLLNLGESRTGLMRSSRIAQSKLS